ncbi:MAG: transcriptional regulator BetI [Oceanospirillaceae bacterium]|jgi:TetR/AcrR family transcriptional repressor of bet genes|nr:transcriptional regulator BetI [Oceanospirillaceae bacterium]MBT4442736.1 transcriptional regulator BetI [Oceanospirillaceae bacterium]MBT6078021.1 transcriptional regulator BetI [Oceanospirillaceae bacterium]
MPKLGMPEVRRPQLIRATMDVINQVGFLNATVAKIGQQAGISPSIINHYFGGKSGLVEATMRSILKDLSTGINLRLSKVPKDDTLARIEAIVGENFSSHQQDEAVVKTWLAFWAQAMHDPTLNRIQRVNEKRLLSYLRLELKRSMPHAQAQMVAISIAALIDGIWLRGALNPQGMNSNLARQVVQDYLLLYIKHS